METPRIAFAPKLLLFSVPSSFSIRSSMAAYKNTVVGIIQIVSHYKNGTLVVTLYMTILRSFWGMGVESTTYSVSGSA